MKLNTAKQRNKEFKKVSVKKFYRTILPKNPTIIDVGANKGQTIEFFKKIFNNLKIYAFEPSEVYNVLEKKYKNSKNIIISKNALHSKRTKKTFYFHTFDSNDVSQLSGFYKINKKSKDHIRINSNKRTHILKNINHSYIVDCFPLDLLLKKIKIDLLKIDTQGNELNILKGAKKLLKNTKFIKLELMFFDYYQKSVSISEIEIFLKKFNFKVFNILEVNQNPVNYKTDWIEILFYNTKIVK